jgi:hypothetical protein
MCEGWCGTPPHLDGVVQSLLFVVDTRKAYLSTSLPTSFRRENSGAAYARAANKSEKSSVRSLRVKPKKKE